MNTRLPTFFDFIHQKILISTALNLTSHSNTSTPISALPEDLIVHIFAQFSHSELRKLSLVSKTFNRCASRDFLWHPIANTLFLPDELRFRLPEISLKAYCKDLLKATHLSHSQKFHQLSLQPREAHFIQRLKEMQLTDFTLLNPSEVNTLISKKYIKHFIERVFPFGITCRLHHAAQQQIGPIKFDILNCTDFVVSFDSEQRLKINNITTTTLRNSNASSCQLFIYIHNNYLAVHHFGLSSESIWDWEDAWNAYDYNQFNRNNQIFYRNGPGYILNTREHLDN